MTTVQDLPQVRGVKNIPVEEQFTSGHRTCQGCESALVMRLMIKAAGPRTIVLGSTGCMYVANTTLLQHALGGALDATPSWVLRDRRLPAPLPAWRR